MSRQSLKIGWLYPDLMSIYGDRGNVIVLQQRSEWREIETKVLPLTLGSTAEELAACDLIFMGGAQDRQQRIVADDIQNKAGTLKKMIDDGVPGLYICGAYQFLGKYYKEADGTIINGLDILDLYTESPGESEKRLIGNTLAISDLLQAPLVGFENHGGRTYLGPRVNPLAQIKKGFGNNGLDGTEGAIYRQSIGTYFHGPILPKNPQLADFLLQKALEHKYQSEVRLEPLDDSLSDQARFIIAKRLGVEL